MKILGHIEVRSNTKHQEQKKNRESCASVVEILVASVIDVTEKNTCGGSIQFRC